MTWKEKTKKVSGNQIIDSSITFDNLGCTIDEDNMASDSATHVPTQQSVKAYIDANGGGGSSQWTTSGSNIYYNTGFVGIGTTTPSTPLHIHTDDPDFIQEMDSTATANLIQHNFNVDEVTEGALLYDKANELFELRTTKELRFGAGNNAERMRIDSSGNVGIGTTSPDQELHVSATATPVIRIESKKAGLGVNESIGSLEFEKTDASGGGSGVASSINCFTTDLGGEVALGFHTGGSSGNNVERMRIDSSGNVGIGTTNPIRALHVNSGNDTIRLQSTSTNTKIEMVNTGSTTNEFGFLSNNFFVSPDGTERLRIDSSGNVLVGTTVTNSTGSSSGGTTTGVEFQPSGELQIGSDGDKCAIFNRQSSDGEILRFRKDGLPVGSIGTFSGDLTIGDDDVGIRFDTGTGLVPWDLGANTTGGQATDGAIDIGASSARFKDLHLSGNVNLGDSHIIGDDAFDNLTLISSSDESIVYGSNTDHVFKTGATGLGATGTEKMRINSSGNVGIGETNPAKPLHVNSGATDVVARFESTDADARIELKDSASTTLTQISVSGDDLHFGTNATERMRIDSSGKVGIGVTDPGFDLDVSGTIKATTGLRVGTSDNVTALSIYSGSSAAAGTFESNATGAYILFRDATSDDVTPAAIGAVGDDCFITAGGSERVRIDDSGNVGIGTNSPKQLLHVQNTGIGDEYTPSTYSNAIIEDTDAYLEIVSNSEATWGSTILLKEHNVVAGDDNDTIDVWGISRQTKRIGDGSGVNGKGDGSLRFTYGTGNDNNTSSTKVTFASSGNVGIGTSVLTSNSIIRELAVKSTATNGVSRYTLTTTDNGLGAAISLSSYLDENALTFGLQTSYDEDGTASPTERMRIDSSGNVGIGTTDPQASLHISAGTSGDATIIIEADTDNNNEDDNPSIGFKQDGGALESQIGHTSYGSANQNALKIANSVASGGIEFLTGTTTGASNATSRMFIDPDGKIAIGGAVDATVDLRVHGETTTDRLGVGSNNLGGYNIESHTSDAIHALFKSSGTTASYIYFRDGNSTIDSAAGFGAKGDECSIVAGGAERVRIDSSGKVGIGVTDPSVELDVSGSIRATTFLRVGTSDNVTALSIYSGSSAAAGTFESNATGAYIVFKDATAQNPTPVGIGAVGEECFIIAGGTEKVRIDDSGNLGIGTNSPAEKLDVQGNITATGVAKLDGGLATAPAYTFDGDTNTGMYSPAADTLAFAEGGAERMRINSAGKVLIGTTSQGSYGAKLRVLGGRIEGSGYVATGNSSLFLLGGNYGAPTIECRSYTSYSSNTQKIMRFAGSTGTERGSITIAGVTTSYNTSSDERLKENISDAEDAGSKIDAIRIRQFDWKDGGEHQDYGVIAQELQTVAPEAVSEGYDEEDMWSVDYSKLVPTLIKEIQTLRNRVAQLENNE